MTDQDNSYRPRSPDFSTFHSPISPPLTHSLHHHHHPPNPNHNNHYLPPSGYQFGSPLAHRASYDASPFFTPQYQQPPAPPARVPQQYIPPFPDSRLDPDMARRSSRIAQAAEVAPVQVSKYVEPVVEEEPPEEEEVVMEVEEEEEEPPHEDEEEEEEEEEEPEPPKPIVAAPIEVKTKFPVARIKRIMQADEDVGKVAQVTPIAVSKALELFMISLVTKAAREAKDRNSKRVTASHLKQAVVKDEVLDFLADIIAKVPDQPAGRKHDDDASDQNEQQPKRKRGGRKPKDESD